MDLIKYILILSVIISCNNTTKNIKDNEWVSLTDGKTFNNWHTYLSDSVKGWTIENGVYTLNPGTGSSNNGLVSNKSYTNFILSVEWKVDKDGNSGIFWGVNEDPKYSVPYLTAAEIQVIDDDVYDKEETKNHLHMNGALYDMVPPTELAANPTGEWNKYVIEINYDKNKGSVTLNDKNVSQFPLYGDEWKDLINNSKFKDWEGFSKTKTGPIAFQDHGTKVYYRNIKIKEL
ncbi:MAG: glycosyl hydrolase [Cytophagia bacterium]|nr:glycosyl hydrolase [Cytophagia bacterium]